MLASNSISVVCCAVALFLLSLQVCNVHAAGCHSTVPSFGPTNDFDVLDGNSNLKFLRSVTNGTLYEITVPNGVANSTYNATSSFYVIHVFGTPQDWGVAQAELLGPVIKEFVDRVWIYLESQVEEVLKYVPNWLAAWIANLGLDVALDLTYDATEHYTNADIFVELQAACDAAGIDYKKARRVHMIAGLTQGKCSMFGAWGKALDPSSGINLLQLRALDWDMDGPFRDYSAITVYHPVNPEGTFKYGRAFANVGMAGFIGAVSGFSSAQLAISEIGVTYPDSTFGSESRIGYPFIFLLRDILQYDYTVDDATSRMAMAKRTCDLILGVGDGKENIFRGYEYSSSELYVFDDDNLRPYNDTWHPRIDDVVYWGMDWICPAYNYVLSQQIQKYYGQITPEIAIKYLTAVEMSGDNHLIYYDLTNMNVYVSFAAPFNVSGPAAAYARQFTRLNATALFAETPRT